MKRYVVYHRAKDLQKMGCKLTGKKKDIGGLLYLEVELNKIKGVK